MSHIGQMCRLKTEKRTKKSNPLISLAWAEMRVIFAKLLWHFDREELFLDSTNWIENKRYTCSGKKEIWILE
jgi:hypothetical protein